MQLDDTLENYLRKVADFHGCFQKAPGIVIGCYMVEYAMELIGETQGKLNAVVETRVCLSDCIQIMTGCTLGNKALKVRDQIGKYAFTLYDRGTKRGVRVFLDVSRIDRQQFPELYAFHTRTRDPRVLTDMRIRRASGQRVVDEFLKIKRGVLSFEHVVVDLPSKEPMLPSVPCRRCGEPFLFAGKPETSPEAVVCGPCQGQSYYHATDPRDATVGQGAVVETVASCSDD